MWGGLLVAFFFMVFSRTVSANLEKDSLGTFRLSMEVRASAKDWNRSFRSLLVRVTWSSDGAGAVVGRGGIGAVSWSLGRL